ncbi:hypothetical protein CHELA1G11_14237 [Hyphomicrobiales bacterium]|nr:hypothetical protein CHELA1G2_10076 [Hyphomicrobiales bacterium]CAH1677192.1 hypothetical protein CHELA1G11_14237 [Hyphomicrobiales bacterium]
MTPPHATAMNVAAERGRGADHGRNDGDNGWGAARFREGGATAHSVHDAALSGQLP